MPPSPDTIALLDDEPSRLAAMSDLLHHMYPQFAVRAFPHAPAMLAWLQDHCETCMLISLDHDLEPDASGHDPGTGRDVADWLATRSPVCPVIVHSTNAPAAAGMLRVLEEAGWTTCRVMPYEDLQWIGELWWDHVQKLLNRRGNWEDQT